MHSMLLVGLFSVLTAIVLHRQPSETDTIMTHDGIPRTRIALGGRSRFWALLHSYQVLFHVSFMDAALNGSPVFNCSFRSYFCLQGLRQNVQVNGHEIDVLSK